MNPDQVHPRKWSRTAAVLFLIASPWATVVDARADGGDPGVIHACVNKAGVVMVADPLELCSSAATPLHWPTVTRVQVLENQVAALQAENGTQQAAISTLQNQVAALQAENASQTQSISTLQNTVNTLVSQSAAQGSAITALQAALSGEQAARVNADAALQAQINAISTGGFLSDLEIVSDASAPAHTNSHTAQAFCPQGKLIVGGGAEYQITGGSDDFPPIITRSLPGSFPVSDSWFAHASTFSSVADSPTWLLKVWAVCASAG